MRVLFPSWRFGLGGPVGGKVWRLLGIAGGLWGGAALALAGEGQNEKLGRLGFAFDPQAHDAAVAAAKARQATGGGADDAPPAGVVRLPNYVVQDGGVPLTEHEILTKKGRLETAKQRYLNVGYQKTLGQVAAVASFLHNVLLGWAPNGPEAMALYEDDERKRRSGEMRDLADLAALSETLNETPTRAADGKPPAKK